MNRSTVIGMAVWAIPVLVFGGCHRDSTPGAGSVKSAVTKEDSLKEKLSPEFAQMPGPLAAQVELQGGADGRNAAQVHTVSRLLGLQKNPVVPENEMSALIPADTCTDVETAIKTLLVEEMEARVDEWLDKVLYPWGWECWWYYGYGDCDCDSDGMDSDGTGGGWYPPPPEPEESASEYSETNTQVEGVDEADFIKNDGAWIYVVANGQFRVIDAWPAPEAHVEATVEIEGEPKKLYVHNDRALIYSSLQPLSAQPAYGYGDYYGGSNNECTYGYDCKFTGDGRSLKVTVLDITDPAEPKLEREVYFGGSYLNSRRIGDTVYTVIYSPDAKPQGLQYLPSKLAGYWDPWAGCWWDSWEVAQFGEDQYDAVVQSFEKLKQVNKQLIESLPIEELVPSVKDVRYVDGGVYVTEEPLAGCNDFWLTQTGDGKSLVSVVTVDIDHPWWLSATSVVGKPGAVYASKDNLYLAIRHYANQMNGWFDEGMVGNKEATTVHRFQFLGYGLGTLYAGSGLVKGRILNQFSMDEHDGFLRIATTTGHVPSPDVHSTVSVLETGFGQMELTGMVDDIAPTEDIRSVRFNGDVGFVVTFKKTDPLFVLDLADPWSPFIKSELKIPGFSTYMHLMDAGHLLTIGYDFDDQGSWGWFQGILLQVFDVTDLENPTLQHKEVIGTRGSTSDAATDHLAFNYFAPKDLLAIPMVICEGGSGGSYGDEMTFSGLLVYDVTVEEGFKLVGGIDHPDPVTGAYAGTCSNWWTQSNSKVKRSVIMDDYVYSVALDLINVAHLDDLDSLVAGISLE